MVYYDQVEQNRLLRILDDDIMALLVVDWQSCQFEVIYSDWAYRMYEKHYQGENFFEAWSEKGLRLVVEDLGAGQYKLTFGPSAETALSGSMTLRVTTSADDTTTDTITVGSSTKEITVVGNGGGETGTGTFADEAIMKDGMGDNEGVSYGGYDYSGSNPAQIGLFDSSVDQVFTYRLFINRKNVSMKGVVVTDVLPDGMYYNGDVSMVICHVIDPSTMTTTNQVITPESITISGKKLTIRFGDIDAPIEVKYSVFIPAQSSVQLKNHAEVTYTRKVKPTRSPGTILPREMTSVQPTVLKAWIRPSYRISHPINGSPIRSDSGMITDLSKGKSNWRITWMTMCVFSMPMTMNGLRPL